MIDSKLHNSQENTLFEQEHTSQQLPLHRMKCNKTSQTDNTTTSSSSPSTSVITNEYTSSNNNKINWHTEWLSSHHRLCLCFLRVVMLQTCRVLCALHDLITHDHYIISYNDVNNCFTDTDLYKSNNEKYSHCCCHHHHHFSPETTQAYRLDHFRNMFYGNVFDSYQQKNVSKPLNMSHERDAKQKDLSSVQKESAKLTDITENLLAGRCNETAVKTEMRCESTLEDNHRHKYNHRYRRKEICELENDEHACTCTDNLRVIKEASKEVLLNASHLLRCSEFDWDAFIEFIRSDLLSADNNSSNNSNNNDAISEEVFLANTTRKLLQQTSWVAIAQMQLSEYILQTYKETFTVSSPLYDFNQYAQKENKTKKTNEFEFEEEYHQNSITWELRNAVDLATVNFQFIKCETNIADKLNVNTIHVNNILETIFPEIKWFNTKQKKNIANPEEMQKCSKELEEHTTCSFNCPHVWLLQCMPYWLLYEVVYSQHSIVWYESRLLQKCFTQWRKRYGLTLLQHLESNNKLVLVHNVKEFRSNEVSAHKKSVVTTNNNSNSNNNSIIDKCDKVSAKSCSSKSSVLDASSIAKSEQDDTIASHSVSSTFIHVMENSINNRERNEVDRSNVNNNISNRSSSSSSSREHSEYRATDEFIETIVLCDETAQETSKEYSFSLNVNVEEKKVEEVVSTNNNEKNNDVLHRYRIDDTEQQQQQQQQQEQELLLLSEISNNTKTMTQMAINKVKEEEKEEEKEYRHNVSGECKTFLSRAIKSKASDIDISNGSISSNNKINNITNDEMKNEEEDSSEVKYYLTLADHLYMEKIKRLTFDQWLAIMIRRREEKIEKLRSLCNKHLCTKCFVFWRRKVRDKRKRERRQQEHFIVNLFQETQLIIRYKVLLCKWKNLALVRQFQFQWIGRQAWKRWQCRINWNKVAKQRGLYDRNNNATCESIQREIFNKWKSKRYDLASHRFYYQTTIHKCLVCFKRKTWMRCTSRKLSEKVQWRLCNVAFHAWRTRYTQLHQHKLLERELKVTLYTKWSKVVWEQWVQRYRVRKDMKLALRVYKTRNNLLLMCHCYKIWHEKYHRKCLLNHFVLQQPHTFYYNINVLLSSSMLPQMSQQALKRTKLNVQQVILDHWWRKYQLITSTRYDQFELAEEFHNRVCKRCALTKWCTKLQERISQRHHAIEQEFISHADRFHSLNAFAKCFSVWRMKSIICARKANCEYRYKNINNNNNNNNSNKIIVKQAIEKSNEISALIWLARLPVHGRSNSPCFRFNLHAERLLIKNSLHYYLLDHDQCHNYCKSSFLPYLHLPCKNAWLRTRSRSTRDVESFSESRYEWNYNSNNNNNNSVKHWYSDNNYKENDNIKENVKKEENDDNGNSQNKNMSEGNNVVIQPVETDTVNCAFENKENRSPIRSRNNKMICRTSGKEQQDQYIHNHSVYGLVNTPTRTARERKKT